MASRISRGAASTLWAAMWITACGGSDGKSGTNGLAGEAGPPGASEPGPAGEPGTNGTNGTSPTAQEIDDAINAALDAREGDGGTPVVNDDGGGGVVATGCDAIELDPPDPSEGVQYSLAMRVEPGQDVEYCQLFVLEEDLNLNEVQNRYPVGSHHVLVWHTAYKDVLPTEDENGNPVDAGQPHPCTGGLTWTGNWVGGAQGSDGSSTPSQILPDDVAFRLKKGDVIMLDYHLLNTTDEPIEGCYKANLIGIPDSQVAEEAGFIRFYNPWITVPPNGEATAKMNCEIPAAIHLASAVSHAHARLDDYTAQLLSGEPGQAGTTVVDDALYTGTTWNDPPVKLFSPAKDISAGQWIEFECHYSNTTDAKYAQGFKATDEMCMFNSVYWPKQDALGGLIGCVDNGQYLGSGTKTGAEFLGCWWNSPQVIAGGGPETLEDRYTTQGCVTDTCEEASRPIKPYLDCLTANAPTCQETCIDAQASFQAVCALTPAAQGGCQEKFGTNGADGTCAADAGPLAVAACSTAVQQASLTNQCKTTLCSALCTDPTAQTCLDCVGTFTPVNPPTMGGGTNDTCLNSLTFACVAAQGETIATECATACFTDCITNKITSCVVQDCLHGSACAAEYGAVASATCN